MEVLMADHQYDVAVLFELNSLIPKIWISAFGAPSYLGSFQLCIMPVKELSNLFTKCSPLLIIKH